MMYDPSMPYLIRQRNRRHLLMAAAFLALLFLAALVSAQVGYTLGVEDTAAHAYALSLSGGDCDGESAGFPDATPPGERF
jgi:hypothetical protein